MIDNETRIPIWLDTDPGVDDAMAMALLFAIPEYDVKGISAVAGNVELSKTFRNARNLTAFFGRKDVPVYPGAEKPLFRAPRTAYFVHGENGLGNVDLPESDAPVEQMPAWDALYEAAKVVFESGIPIYMAGLDVTEKALVFPEDFERIRAVGNQVARVVADWLEFFYGFHRNLGYPGAPVHDAVAVAALIKPEIMTFKDLYVQVETAGDFCKGTTVGDWYGVTGKAPNASCILNIDRQAFVDLLVEAVKTYD